MTPIHKIHYTSRFIRDLKKLSKDIVQQAAKRERIFKKDAFAATLKTHKLTGKLKDHWSFSITFQDHVLFKFINPNEVIFYKIGSHDIYK